MRIDVIDRKQLLATFLEAFSDYAVYTGHTTEELLRARFIKNNVDYERSVGAFDGNRMVGFTAIAIDRREGEKAAFDAATGIVPGYRGRGLAARMFEQALPALRAAGIKRFLLEVLQDNQPAIGAYRKAGFEATREFSCYLLDPRPSGEGEERDPLPIRAIDREAACCLEDHLDWQPSWEVTFDAIRRIPDDLVSFGAFDRSECVGAIVYSPILNWILTLVVRHDYRRRRIGSALVRRLAGHFPENTPPLKLINVLQSDRGMRSFLDRTGFRHWIDQYEMSRPI